MNSPHLTPAPHWRKVKDNTNHRGANFMNLTTLGIDLAKTSFSLVGMDERGKVILRKTLKRDALMAMIWTLLVKQEDYKVMSV
jgi:hypothetical protein